MLDTNSNTALINMNVRLLCQALDLLGVMDDGCFLTSPRGFSPCRVSSQLRHVLEFYECFLAGLEPAHIDYDARQRDTTIEASRAAARNRVRSLIDRLQAAPELAFDDILFVRAEDADSLGLCNPFLVSSVGRELLSLSSHTVHHFALIAMTLRAHGVMVDPDFGVAPSTLRHREQAPVALAHEAA
jgi:hypothetical protein